METKQGKDIKPGYLLLLFVVLKVVMILIAMSVHNHTVKNIILIASILMTFGIMASIVLIAIKVVKRS